MSNQARNGTASSSWDILNTRKLENEKRLETQVLNAEAHRGLKFKRFLSADEETKSTDFTNVCRSSQYRDLDWLTFCALDDVSGRGA